MAVEQEVFDLSVLWSPIGRAEESAGNAPEGRVWLSAVSRMGAVHGVPLAASRGGAGDLLGQASRRFQELVGNGMRGAGWAATVGAELADVVFGVPEIATLLHRTRGAALDQGRHLLLRVQGAPALVAGVPWELIADPEGPGRPAALRPDDERPVVRPETHLALAPDGHVARMARARTYPVRTEPVPPPLRLLLILSNPEDPVPSDEIAFDLFEERRALLAELQHVVDRGLLEVDVESRPSVDSIRRRIASRDGGYHLVHYLGHARPDGLKLEGRDGRAHWVPPETLNAALRSCPDLRLVFYAGCRTATQTSGGTTWPEVLSIADVAVRDACPTVIGMQAQLPFRTEQILTRFFYQALASGQTVAEALKLARLAIHDDDVVGDGLLDWAVPTLVTSSLPGALLDLDAPGRRPAALPRRAELRLGLREPDREFFARQLELQRVLEVLCRRRASRVLWVVGPPRAGKTRLVARALDELEDVDAVLYVPLDRLGADAPAVTSAEAPVEALCELVFELLSRAKRSPRRRAQGWTAADWWDRLIEDLTDSSFVLVIDEVDRMEGLDEAARAALGAALTSLVRRRTAARLVLVAPQPMPHLLDPATASFATVQAVPPLGPPDVWQWIRRNRPGLVRFGYEQLAGYYSRLPTLEQWNALADLVSEQPLTDLADAVDAISPPTAVPGQGAGPQQAPSTAPRAQGGPVRVAAIGRHFVGRADLFARLATDHAAQQGLGGRVVTGTHPDASASIAELLVLPSPFSGGREPSDDDLDGWLRGALQARPDVVLLDLDHAGERAGERGLVEELVAAGALVLAPAHGADRPGYPAWYAGVLAVGAIRGAVDGAGGAVAEDCFRDPAAGKPELFADDLMAVGGQYVDALAELQGASAAALNVAAAALTVWSADRSQSGATVRQVLLDTAAPLDDPHGARRLAEDAALRWVRRGLLAQALQARPLRRDDVGAATGLSPQIVQTLVQELLGEGSLVVRSTAAGQLLARRDAD